MEEREPVVLFGPSCCWTLAFGWIIGDDGYFFLVKVEKPNVGKGIMGWLKNLCLPFQTFEEAKSMYDPSPNLF